MSHDLIIPKYSLVETKVGDYAEEIAQLYCKTISVNHINEHEGFNNMLANVLHHQRSNIAAVTACVDYDDSLIGAVSYGFYRDYEPNHGRIFKIAVQPEHQRGGVGRELLSYAESCLTVMGAIAIELNAKQAAIDFYKKAGYEMPEGQSEPYHFFKSLLLP